MPHRRRRTWLPLGIALGLAAAATAAIVLPNAHDGSPPLQASGAGAIRTTPEGQRLPELVGVSSCLASSCHGGERSDKAWQSAYAVWVADDPHARAFETLLGSQSQAIYRRLQRVSEIDETKYLEFLDARCTSCHATFDAAPADARLTEGVSCESCHGAASGWLKAHSKQGWVGGSGMTNTRDLDVRAQACVGCHIGLSPGGGSGPSRPGEVNHDLIAAGHPRLAFEFAAYLSRLPAHWDVARDRKESRKLWKDDPAGSFELEAWWAGQLASVRRALEQLQARAIAASGLSQEAVWPEFSENDCFACHHQLGSPSFRQQPAFRLRPREAVPWGDWHFSALSRVLAAVDPPRSRWRGIMEALRHEMARPMPDPREVRRLSQEALGELKQSQQLSIAPRTIAIAATQDLDRHRWDELTAWHFAAAALLKAPTAKTVAQPGNVSMLLGDLHNQLKFPVGRHSAERYASPVGYDPQKLKPNLDRVRQAILQLYGLSAHIDRTAPSGK